MTLTNWYPPHHFGGYELSCFDVMAGFMARGHEVAVLCSDEVVPTAAAPDPHHEANVRRELTMYHRGGQLWQPSRRERLAVERRNHAALERALSDAKPDVVSAWHFGALSLGLLTAVAEAGIPIVYAVCDDWLIYGQKLDVWAKLFSGNPLRRATGRVMRSLLRVPTVVPDLGPTGAALFVTDTIRERADLAAPWRFERDTVVYSGIHRDTFPPIAGEPDDRKWQWRLVCTGRFDPRKGFETAIRSLLYLPDESTLRFFGKGGDDERHRLQQVAHELGLGERVTFGSVERDELPEVYRAADVMVFPSEWEEPFGLVPVEAMACATPVVATVMGGSREFLFDHVNVLRYPPGDPGALAAAIRQLYEDPQLRRRLVEAGLQTAEDLDVEHLVDVMEAWHLYAVSGWVGEPPPDRSLSSSPADSRSSRQRAGGSGWNRRLYRWWKGDHRPLGAGMDSPHAERSSA